ncbi:CopG family ribbon-helix-helix protein [Asticcacaulis sp. BYS171W]|uniref:CopG family ribbon-helix-helix protein n=1 Tax=Asticcacaulis aquaticus TaxID=2984212 RepID=A0ABT5HVP9_9CAUL|nr:CopG family ribbon-helix-helix protein [Asticcacaulis aquaticus]MDC7684167.1 CopG family ribbon-helix-helix protein [Asticcacaulis aquaticus]
MPSTTMTIRVSTDVKARLERLAESTQRSQSWLAGEAVSAYVERELAIVEGIRQGMEDACAGRTVSHEEAMAELQAIIDAAQSGRA